MNATPIIWCVYIGTNGNHHAIIKEDFDFMSQFIWPADCPILATPIANGERMRYAALPPGEVPKFWKDAQATQ